MKNQEKVELKNIFNELRNGNKDVIEELYEKYNKMIYGIAFSILKNQEDSEDIVQTVFSKLYTIEQNKMPKDKEATWLYSTTKNEAITFLRKRNNNIDLDSIYEIKDEDNEINKIVDQDSYNRLISRLNEKEKEIISLRILSNLSFEEIGEVLNVPTGTVKWRYYKSLHTLKLLLSNLGMFIATFITGIVAFKNGAKVSQNQVEQGAASVEDNEIVKDEDISGSLREDVDTEKKEEINTESNEILKEDKNVQENIIIDTQLISNNTNYVGLSFMGISVIFFIVTIIFSIIFTKHQLKRRKKLSK